MWLKAGEIVRVPENFSALVISKEPRNSTPNRISCFPSNYPDFFEPIREEDEKLEEAKKLLEKAGAKVTWP